MLSSSWFVGVTQASQGIAGYGLLSDIEKKKVYERDRQKNFNNMLSSCKFVDVVQASLGIRRIWMPGRSPCASTWRTYRRNTGIFTELNLILKRDKDFLKYWEEKNLKIDRQSTDRRSDSQTNKYPDSQTDKQSDRQTVKQTDSQTVTQSDSKTIRQSDRENIQNNDSLVRYFEKKRDIYAPWYGYCTK